MYLTAQRVSSPSNQREGVNALLYRHEDGVPWLDWTAPDLVRIANEHPGRLAASAITVPPGGNLVQSYLDIVAAENTPAEAVVAALDQFRRDFNDSQFGRVVSIGTIRIRLATESSRRRVATQELDELAGAALDLLRNPQSTQWPVERLRIEVSENPEGLRFALDSPSVARLRAVHGPHWLSASVSVSPEIRADAGSPGPLQRANLFPQLATAMTGLDLDAVLRLGGVEFRSGETLLWEWPDRTRLVGYCLGCHQHATLRRLDGQGYRCSDCGNAQETDGLWVATAL